jgi:hypothetical protein
MGEKSMGRPTDLSFVFDHLPPQAEDHSHASFELPDLSQLVPDEVGGADPELPPQAQALEHLPSLPDQASGAAPAWLFV